MTRSHGTRGLTFCGIFIVSGQPGDAVAHGGQIDHRGHAGEVLKHDAAGHERDFRLARGVGAVLREGLDVIFGDHEAIEVAQARFQQHLDAVRQAAQVAQLAQGVEAVDGALAEGGLEGAAGLERVVGRGGIGQGFILAVSGGPSMVGRWQCQGRNGSKAF